MTDDELRERIATPCRTNPAELALSLDYAKRRLVKAKEDIAYYEGRLAFARTVADVATADMARDERRLAESNHLAAERTAVAES